MSFSLARLKLPQYIFEYIVKIVISHLCTEGYGFLHVNFDLRDSCMLKWSVPLYLYAPCGCSLAVFFCLFVLSHFKLFLFCFILFYYYSLNAWLFSKKNRKDVDMNWKRGGQELEGIGCHIIWKKIYFQ